MEFRLFGKIARRFDAADHRRWRRRMV